VVEYYHRGVVCHLMGFDLALPLDVEMIHSGEGEVPAAKRLLERVFHNYSRFFDGVVADSLYLEAPFFNFCLKHRKHVVAVLKRKDSLLLQEAGEVFQNHRPKTWEESRTFVEAWDAGNFISCEKIDRPLRVLHSEETEYKRERIAGKWIETSEHHTWHWATTIPADLLPTRQLWEVGHRRWDVENDLFNTLVNSWALDHCFKHDPVAILNFILTLFIAFVLVQSFYRRNLNPKRRGYLTLIAIADHLYVGLASPHLRVPWLQRILERSP
jgi:hypothetical protein